MKLPRGRLVRSRVVEDPGTALSTVLARGLTGYVVMEPQDALLLGADDRGVLTFEAGVPVLAYHAGTDRGGPAALADLATPGPYSADLYELDPSDLAAVHDTPPLQVPPGMPAERLAGDPHLADRTRDAVPAAHPVDAGEDDAASPDSSAVEAFLDDEEKLAAIREQAREEARRRAEEWGLADELE